MVAFSNLPTIQSPGQFRRGFIATLSYLLWFRNGKCRKWVECDAVVVETVAANEPWSLPDVIYTSSNSDHMLILEFHVPSSDVHLSERRKTVQTKNDWMPDAGSHWVIVLHCDYWQGHRTLLGSWNVSTSHHFRVLWYRWSINVNTQACCCVLGFWLKRAFFGGVWYFRI